MAAGVGCSGGGSGGRAARLPWLGVRTLVARGAPAAHTRAALLHTWHPTPGTLPLGAPLGTPAPLAAPHRWRDLLHLVDIVCCCVILFPIVWSIKHLREAAESDGKAARALTKLSLFRTFYIMVVAYIYFTRIIVYLLQSTLPYRSTWLANLGEPQPAGSWLAAGCWLAVGWWGRRGGYRVGGPADALGGRSPARVWSPVCLQRCLATPHRTQHLTSQPTDTCPCLPPPPCSERAGYADLLHRVRPAVPPSARRREPLLCPRHRGGGVGQP
jgi:hypothetical protein